MIRRKISTPTPDSSEDFHLLEGLDNAVESLLSIGKTKKASDCMNQALKIRINLYGDNSKEVLSYLSFILKKTCASCSSLIEKDKLQSTIELLRNLLVLSSNYPLAQIAPETCEVYNTLACALRKNSKPKIAKKYAMKSLALANSFKASEKLLSSIYLNLCAIYSTLSQHKEAAMYCSQAIQLAQEDLLNLKLSKPSEDYHQEVAVLAVAYHNLGVEEEYLKNYEIALSWYRKAIKFLDKHASSSHFSMLEEFKKSYEDAQRSCKLKYHHVHLNRTMKDDYFFDESSLSEIEAKSMSVKSKTHAQGFRVSGFTKIPNLPIGRVKGRSESGSSLASLSKRQKKLMEMDSDIRELNDLGLLEHEKVSSRRSSSTVRSGDLSPIKGRNLKNEKNAAQVFDYSENVFKIRRSEESARHRKVIKKDPGNQQFIVLRAVIKLQNFFRVRRLRRWYKEIQTGKLFGVMLKCERIVNNQKYLVSFCIEKKENSLGVVIKALPLISVNSPEPGRYSLFEVCSLLGAWDTKKFEIKKSELLIYIYIEDNKVILRKTSEIYLQNTYQGAKRLNNMFSYQVTIYTIMNPNAEPSLLIDGRPLKKSPPIVRVLIISVKELSSILSVKTQDLQRNLDKVLNLVIIEGDGELTLSKRSISADIPMINILTTNTDDFTDQYKQYENSAKRVNKEETKGVVFCVGNSDEGKAALIIQKNLRAREERRRFLNIKDAWALYGYKCGLGEFYKAVLGIQRCVKRWKVRKSERKAAVKIQAGFRGWKVRKDIKSLREAAVTIQTVFRGWKARKIKNNGEDKVKFEEKKGKSMKETKKYEENKVKIEEDKGKNKSKIAKNKSKIGENKEKVEENKGKNDQSKGKNDQNKGENDQNKGKNDQNKGKNQKITEKELNDAATLIQSKFKSHKAQKDYKELKSKHIKACTKIQRMFRKSRIQKQKPLKPPTPSQVTPKPARIKESPKQSPKSRNIRFHAIIIIQKFIKGRKIRKYYLNLKKSAITIQKNFRAFSCRKEFKRKILELRALKLIQKSVKKWLNSVRGQKKSNEKNEEASVVIQKHVKGSKARKEHLEIKKNRSGNIESLNLLKSAVMIQRIFRGFKARKQVKEVLNLQEIRQKAAVILQKRFKGFVQRKKFVDLVKYLHYAQKGVSFVRFLKALLTIQKFLRGWKVRKSYKRKVKIQINSHLNSALIIQKYIKGWKARKIVEDLKDGNLAITRFGALLENSPYLVIVSKTEAEFILKLIHVVNLKTLYRRFPVSSTEINSITENLSMKNQSIFLSPEKSPEFQVKLIEKTKRFYSEDYKITIFLEPTCYFIAFSANEKNFTLKLNFSKLYEKYSDKIPLNELIEDLNLVNNKIVLEPNVILVKKSKYAQGRLNTITMYEKKGNLMFEIMFGSSSKKKIVINISEAVENTGISSGVIALGWYLIEHCFVYRGKKIIILYKKKNTDNLPAIIKVQANIRGFITRRRLKKRYIILVTEKNIRGSLYKLYCYYSFGKFTITAQLSSSSYTLLIEKTLNPSDVLEHLRKSILPTLTLTDTQPIKLIQFTPILHTEKIPIKTPNSFKSSKLSQKSPMGFISLTPNLNIASKKIMNEKIPEKSTVYKKRPKNSSRFDETSNSVKSEQLSPQMTPTIHLKKPDFEFNSTLKSITAEKIILKTGFCISGIYLIITMKLQEEGVYVKAVNETGLIDLDLVIKTKRVARATEKEIEELCSELLMQLKIVSDIDGRMRLALIDSSDEDRDDVMYRRSHYISNRYFTITIFENFRGVFLVASENERNVFHMKLGRRRVGNSQKTQEELNELVKKLKVQVVLGQEMLVLSS